MELISTKIVRARKNHICNYCDGIIRTGEKYRYSVLKNDDIYVWKNHIKCEDIANKLGMHEESIDGLTAEYFREFIDEEYLDCCANTIPNPKSFEEKIDAVIAAKNESK